MTAKHGKGPGPDEGQRPARRGVVLTLLGDRSGRRGLRGDDRGHGGAVTRPKRTAASWRRRKAVIASSSAVLVGSST